MTAHARTLLRLASIVATLMSGPLGTSPLLAADRPAGDSSMRMYRDPETGAIGAPSAAAMQAAAAAAAPRPSAPLTEEPVGAPAGGVKVNLRGAHRPAVVRHSGTNGSVHECVDGRGGAGE